MTEIKPRHKKVQLINASLRIPHINKSLTSLEGFDAILFSINC